MSTPAEYRAARRAVVECPSGLTVPLHKFDPADILLHYDLQPATVIRARELVASGVEIADLPPKILREKYGDIHDLACASICTASAAAKAAGMEGLRLVAHPTEENDQLCIHELDSADIEALGNVVNKWLDVSPEVVATVAPFCDEGNPTGDGAALELQAVEPAPQP